MTVSVAEAREEVKRMIERHGSAVEAVLMMPAGLPVNVFFQLMAALGKALAAAEKKRSEKQRS